jgi:transposase-like protein
MTQDDEPEALRQSRELTAQILHILRNSDHAETGWVLAWCTSAWLRTFKADDDEEQKKKWAELLTYHTTAIVRLLWGPDGPK